MLTSTTQPDRCKAETARIAGDISQTSLCGCGANRRPLDLVLRLRPSTTLLGSDSRGRSHATPSANCSRHKLNTVRPLTACAQLAQLWPRRRHRARRPLHRKKHLHEAPLATSYLTAQSPTSLLRTKLLRVEALSSPRGDDQLSKSKAKTRAGHPSSSFLRSRPAPASPLAPAPPSRLRLVK